MRALSAACLAAFGMLIQVTAYGIMGFVKDSQALPGTGLPGLKRSIPR